MIGDGGEEEPRALDQRPSTDSLRAGGSTSPPNGKGAHAGNAGAGACKPAARLEDPRGFEPRAMRGRMRCFRVVEPDRAHVVMT